MSNAAVWAYTRQGKRPAWACRLLELVSTVTAMAVFAPLPLFPPIEGAGGAMALVEPGFPILIFTQDDETAAGTDKLCAELAGRDRRVAPAVVLNEPAAAAN